MVAITAEIRVASSILRFNVYNTYSCGYFLAHSVEFPASKPKLSNLKRILVNTKLPSMGIELTITNSIVYCSICRANHVLHVSLRLQELYEVKTSQHNLGQSVEHLYGLTLWGNGSMVYYGLKPHQCLLVCVWKRMDQLPCRLLRGWQVSHQRWNSGNVNKAAHSSFETKRKHHKKSKHMWIHKKDLCLLKNF